MTESIRAALCAREGCGHFLTVHTRGMALWDRCLIPGCKCEKAMLPKNEMPIKMKHQFITGGAAVQDNVEKEVVTAEQVGKVEDVMPELLATPEKKQEAIDQAVSEVVKKVVKLGEKATIQADAFIRIAKENNGVVTLAQAKEVNEKSPSDLAYYARQRGAEITTDKKKGGATQWLLVKE